MIGSEIQLQGDGKAPLVMDLVGGPPVDEILSIAQSEFERVNKPMAAALVQWTRSMKTPASRAGTIFDRDRYVTPETAFEKMRVARLALADDVIGGIAETTESLAFSKQTFFHPNRDQEDVWNQWARDVNLDARIREQWRIEFTDSQSVAAVWWGKKTYRVRGKTKNGNKARKTFANLTVPLGVSFIDTIKVTPVGSLMFNQERLAYIADPLEATNFDAILRQRDGGPAELPPAKGRGRAKPAPRAILKRESAPLPDPLVEQLIERRYEPGEQERLDLQADGVRCENLFLLREKWVFRHTLTRPQWKRFADVRGESWFQLLDMKQLLRQMDRAFLIGGTNFIILITKGTDAHAAEPEEIANLQGMAQVLATIPVLVGDHRLQVQIITPPLDNILNRDKYDTLDVRLAARGYQTFVATGDDNADPLKLGKVIAEGLESRRHMQKRSWEEHLFRLMVEMNEELDEDPDLLFLPQQIALSFDQALASFVLEMRGNNEMSRFTALGQFGIDQTLEAAMREREKSEGLDDIFQTLAQPGAAPAKTEPVATGPGAQRKAGRTGGGTRNGGGAAPGSGQGKPAIRPRKKSD